MLHRINPACTEEFEWVRQLQRDLLTAACVDGLAPDDINVEWAQVIRPEIDAAWISSLLGRRDKIDGIKRSLLEHLRAIAATSDDKKATILGNFLHNGDFSEAFNSPIPTPHPLRPVSALADENLQKAVRGFFTIFYDPEFYKDKGFPVPTLGTGMFTRDVFVSKYRSTNPGVGVCVLCDGDLGDPDVDHFYAKKHFPDLATSPVNLVPICKTCNGRNRKGEKAPMDELEADPMGSWFHPYFRSASGLYSVQFVVLDGVLCPKLISDDPVVQKRLENLDWLIGLNDRWQTNLNHVFRSLAKKLRQVGPEQYQTKLAEWAQNEQDDIGEIAGALLRRGCYSGAADGLAILIDEIRIVMDGLDPITAN